MGPDPAPADDRYSRQIRFAPIGVEGQRRISAATVLVVGCGALGTAMLDQLVRAGVGTVRLVDRDFVEPSNLQRQSLFDEADAAACTPKAIAAAACALSPTSRTLPRAPSAASSAGSPWCSMARIISAPAMS